MRAHPLLLAAVLTLLPSLGAIASPTAFNVVSGEVTFEIDAPLDVISGASRGVSGTATIDPAAWTTAPQAKIDVDLTTFRTGIDLRDEDLRDQFFETSKFMKASLTLGAIERPSLAALVDGQGAEAILAGTLSLHGVEEAVKIPARVTYDVSAGGTRVVVTGDFVIPLAAYKIERPKRLVFKLGTDVKVHVRAVLRGPAPSATPGASAVANAKPFVDEPTGPAPPPVVALKQPEPPKPPTFVYAADTAEGRGERAFSTKKTGGADNALSCKSCHSTQDPRKGLVEPSGVIKPSSTMWNAASRATLWQGIATSPGHASEICAKLFMRKADGLDDKTKADLEAYLKKLAPDPQPPLDYEAIHITRRSSLANPTTGNATRGKKLVEVYCAACHEKGRARPPLEAGLYEADMLVMRVRRLPGADNQQMPLFTVNKLPDSELRDIVTYLVGDEKTRIFKRKR